MSRMCFVPGRSTRIKPDRSEKADIDKWKGCPISYSPPVMRPVVFYNNTGTYTVYELPVLTVERLNDHPSSSFGYIYPHPIHHRFEFAENMQRVRRDLPDVAVKIMQLDLDYILVYQGNDDRMIGENMYAIHNILMNTVFTHYYHEDPLGPTDVISIERMKDFIIEAKARHFSPHKFILEVYNQNPLPFLDALCHHQQNMHGALHKPLDMYTKYLHIVELPLGHACIQFFEERC